MTNSWTNTIPWYGIMTVIGAITAIFFIFIRWRENGYSKFHFSLLTTFTLIFALFGARWWYLAFHPEHFTGMIDLLRISEGRAIQGAVFFGGLFIWSYTKTIAPDLKFAKIASMIVPHVLLAQAIGRWGNFHNQEIYGAIVSQDQLWFLPSFIREGMYVVETNQIGVIISEGYRNPLFLWESITNMIGWLILGFIIYDSKWLKDGTLIGIYLFWYNTTRAIMEPMRDPKFIMNINGVPTSFIMAIIFAVFGIWLIIYYQTSLHANFATWIEFKYEFRKRYLLSSTKLVISLILINIKYKEFTTLHRVSKKIYNKNIGNINQKKVDEFRRNI